MSAYIGCDCECCVNCECDFWPKVIIDGQAFGNDTMNISDQNDVHPTNWSFSKEVPVSRGSIPIKIQIWDSDYTTGDDIVRITPEVYDDDQGLDLMVTLSPCSVSGEFYVGGTFGGTAACGTVLQSSGRDGSGVDEFAHLIRFKVDVIDPAAAALGRILFVPFCWLGDPSDFEDKVKEQLDVFYKSLDLDSCEKELFNHEILDPSVINVKCPTIPSMGDPVCQDAMKYVIEAIEAAGYRKGDFNEIVALTDHDICGNTSGGHAGRGYYWAEITDLATFPHEFGHLYDLSDEYTSSEAGGCYNSRNSINFLDPFLACDPRGACCGGCTKACEPCCAGNQNPAGGRCFMSSADFSSYTSGYCARCYNQITNPPNKRTAGFPYGAIGMKCGETNPNPTGLHIVDSSFTLTEEGKLHGFSFDSYDGRASFGSPYSNGPYRMEMMKQGSLVFATNFDRPSPSCEGDGCSQQGPFAMHWKGIAPPGITNSDVLTLSFFKDGLITSRTTLNGQPPVAHPGLDRTVQCDGGGQATVALDGSSSWDPDGDILQYAWSAPGITFSNPAGVTTTAAFPMGTTKVTLVVSDGIHSSEPASIDVEVVDTTPPSIACPADEVVQCEEPTDPSSTGTASVTDICDARASLTSQDQEAAGDCPQSKSIGRTWTASDDSGNTSSCTQTISVVDTIPPVISSTVPASISPPDAPRSFTATAADNCDGSPAVEVTSYTCRMITSNKEKVIGKAGSCVVRISGPTISILDSGGVGDKISWNVRSRDACGNTSQKQNAVDVVKPNRQ